MKKNVTTGAQSRVKLLNGINTVADAVKVTLGAKGNTVIIENSFGMPYATKDGVSVARSIDLVDNEENLGSSMIKEVAINTVNSSGDGTTTATVLAQSLIINGIDALEKGGSSVFIKSGIEKTVSQAIDVLDSMKYQTDIDNLILNIATVSANNDAEIGKLISDTISKTGTEGIITAEEHSGFDTTVSIVDGVQFNRGYVSPYFVTNQDKMEAVLENPYILLCDKKISNMKELLPILEKVVQSGRPLLIIAEDVDGEALTTLVVNKVQRGMKFCVVRSPEIGSRKTDIMEDISLLVKGVYFNSDKGYLIDTAKIEDLGQANKVIVKQDSCTIVGGYGDISIRVDQIKSLIDNSESDQEKQWLKYRLQKLNSSAAIIRVGGASELETREKKDRIDDAICATKAAIEEGVIIGGGVTYLRCAESLKSEGLSEEEKIGFDIVKKSLQSPFKQILKNGGVDYENIIANILNGDKNYGYNIKTNQYEDFSVSGILDPLKVAKIALKNAASIAGVFLTTECVISNIKE
jgi:chaperonin GroEL